jgi:hypothetical protein
LISPPREQINGVLIETAEFFCYLYGSAGLILVWAADYVSLRRKTWFPARSGGWYAALNVQTRLNAALMILGEFLIMCGGQNVR